MNVQNCQGIERRIVRHLIRTMKVHGWRVVEVSYGIGKNVSMHGLEKKVMEAVLSVDNSIIRFENADGMRNHVFITLGNDGWNAISDYSCSGDFPSIIEEEIYPCAEKF